MAPMAPMAPRGSLVGDTLASFDAAKHLDDPQYDGVKRAMLDLARKIDAWDVIVDWALEDVAAAEGKTRPAVPANDNVSLSAYLKFCDQLGLSPAGAKALELSQEGKSGKSAKLTAMRGGRAPAAAAG
ncbi:hypothetical protein OVA14_07165 [Agrococcus sp. SL85]|uniref:terminase small subunit n=1 Tax=Agrococcus sp. SL85 TaxID=2995141 RepID=UPI00226C9B78|nr:hypothetical protein [Agrococcus sp. SL85]WAC65172.1 hypothetical protein OVA14_07165 [Agrococcus sp. SL85]